MPGSQEFSGRNNVFPDPGMTAAAIDRLVHHSTIFELHQVESYRAKQAARQQKTQRDNDKASRRRQLLPAKMLDAVRVLALKSRGSGGQSCFEK